MIKGRSKSLRPFTVFKSTPLLQLAAGIFAAAIVVATEQATVVIAAAKDQYDDDQYPNPGIVTASTKQSHTKILLFDILTIFNRL